MRGPGRRQALEAGVQRARARRVARLGTHKHIVGIDLGTTNTAVAFASAAEDARVKVLEMTQLVAPGEMGGRNQLPSFVYLAGEHALTDAATRLPWAPERRHVVGELARTQGARVPARMIASAKSWLCHPGVDRAAAILPWGTTEGSKLSPVQSSARVLEHVAEVWRSAMGTSLAEQDVVITVPASFDEVARELTVDAAAVAGLTEITLVEEPQAVFYAWIDAHDARARRAALAPGSLVLVCDVGGGTTDFTIIRVAEDGDSFERTAVGDHLLLGGDNVDIALARRVESTLGKLDAVQWQGLVHACRLAKEQFFLDASLTTRSVTIAARGSKLIGGTLKADLTRAEVEELVLDGFFPRVEATARPARARIGLSEFGLPYAADAAITRHLAGFLGRHQVPRIDAVLFNGGAMRPESVRARILDLLGAWQEGARPRELVNNEPELAVARGAAYYGKVRRGVGSRIRGGAARAFYIGVERGGAVCVLPRGAEEGTERELGQDFVAVMNRPVSYRLYSSSIRLDQPGDVVAGAAQHDELAELPPVVTVLRAPGRSDARVRLRARLTELGTLELWCADTTSETKWRLTFDLRTGGAPTETAPPEMDPRVEDAKVLIQASFRAAAGAVEPAALTKELERVLDARRDEWSTSTIRGLWAGVYECEPARVRTADSEARWLNLAGFCLRPGTGAPLDDWRGREMWKIFNLGLRHEKDEACRLAWWIVWRRIAGGLKRGQQEQIYDRIAPLFLPGQQQKSKWYKVKPSPHEAGEMWRTVGSLERLTPAAKTKLGDALVERLEKGRDTDVGFWALGRMGARAPLYGPADAVVSPQVATAWIDRLLAMEWKQPERIVFPAAQLGRLTGDRARDVDEVVRGRLATRLRELPNGVGTRSARLVEEVVELEAREERVAFGDSLPTGLRRAEPPAAEPPAAEPPAAE